MACIDGEINRKASILIEIFEIPSCVLEKKHGSAGLSLYSFFLSNCAKPVTYVFPIGEGRKGCEGGRQCDRSVPITCRNAYVACVNR